MVELLDRSRCLGCVVVLGLVSSACVSTSRTITTRQVEIADAALLALPNAEELREHVDATQLLTGTFDGRSYTMQVQMEWRPGSIAMAALNVIGTTAFSLSYDGSELEVSGNGLVMRGLRPEFVLADMLLTFWEHSALDTRLHGDGIELRDSAGMRAVSRNGRPVIEIRYEGESPWQGVVRFEHIERGYVLRVETVGFSRE